MNTLIYDAAKAGATMENDFKKGIYDGEKAVNSLSEEIIKQKTLYVRHRMMFQCLQSNIRN